MKDELLSLWCLCKVATFFGIVSLQIFGDSRVTIKWDLGEYNLKLISLTPWCYRIQKKLKSFCSINFHHIFKEQNQLVGLLSKASLDGKVGALIWEEILDN